MITVHRKRTNCTVIAGIVFAPGMNHLSEGEFAEVDKTRAFKSEIECGNMMLSSRAETETKEAVEKKDDKKARAHSVAEEIRSLKVEDARKAILDSNNVSVLRALADLDMRKGVQEIVEKRITEIQNQEGDDLTPTSVPAPEGDGSDFAGSIEGKKQDIEGSKGHSAIPALKLKRG